MDARNSRPFAERTSAVAAIPPRNEALTEHSGAVIRGNRIFLSRTAIAGIAGTFLLMGMVGAAYGPLLEHLARHFAITLPVAGASLSVHFAGGLIGTLASMRTMTMLSGRASVMAATAILGTGCAAVALAPAWPFFLGGVFVVGLGWGSLVIGLNQLVAHSEGARRSALLNAVNAAYSAGAVASPILVTAFASAHLSLLYLGAAVAALALIPAAAGIRGQLPVAISTRARRKRALIVIFVGAFVLYVGVEAGIGGWMTSHLESIGLQTRNAAALTSGFWLALAAGRLLFALVPPTVPEPVIVLTGAGVAAVTLLAASIGSLAPWAYIVTGLAIAPIFPTGIVWLAKANPGDTTATSWLFPAASLGGIAGPGSIGLVIAHFGVAWAPVVLSIVAAASFGAFLLARRQILTASPVP
jgi:FHS family glucose/mannose:H+ symporter-like MFS transporter